MKILVITTWFPNPVEPIKCIFTRNILKAQISFTDFQFIVISPIPFFPKALSSLFNGRFGRLSKIELIEQLDNETIIYRPKYFKLPRQLSRYFDWYFYYKAVLKTIKNSYLIFDLIHVHGLYPDSYAGYKISKYYNVPFVCHVHDSYITDLFKSFKNKLLISLTSSQKIIAVSEFQSNQLKKILPNNSNIVVINNGVNLHNFTLTETNLSRNKGVFVGNLIETKGIYVLLEALSIMLKNDVIFYLDVFGTGELSKCKEYSTHLEISDLVNFKGIIDNESLPQAFTQYDFLILPSFYETFGIVLVEAMACGLPVIATNVAAIPEIVNSEDFGILVEPNDAYCLAEGIKIAMKKDWNPKEIRAHAANYTIENTAVSIGKVYDEVLSNIQTQ